MFVTLSIAMKPLCPKIALRSSILLLALIAINLSSPLSAGWNGAEWNMTAEQVAEATEGLAPQSSGKRKDKLDGRLVGNVGEQTLGKAKFRAVYYYDDVGLAQITLNRRSGSCEGVLRALTDQFGEPTEMQDQLILRTLTWLKPQEENRVTMVVSRSLCDVILQRYLP